MPNFEFCYLNANGSLACVLSALCVDETHAKVFAHAMKLSDYKRFEVWHGDTLIYERPEIWIEERDLRPATSAMPVAR